MPRIESPYKFLDSYDESDHAIFFGRERETQILLADIVVSRIVLLFAETGTGKTSLIRAGVTPLLTEREYVTFFVRISEDPATSLCAELRGSGPRLGALGVRIEDHELDLDEQAALAPQLEDLAKAIGRPLVLFLDQFEEFFLYVLRRDYPRALAFISDVGAIQRNPKSKVRIVFSMREDFVGKMDVFRDEIPAIFHRESNLRLRPFDEEQARAAIAGPAAARHVTIAPALETALVEDLLGVEGVDPTELQIVCDTLWRRLADGRIDLGAYHDLGRGAPGSIVESILTQRLEEEFEDLAPAQLDLLGELLPRLSTRGDIRHVPTKYVRDIDGLATELDVDRDVLVDLLDELKEARLIRAGIQPNLVELTHDYLVGQLDELSRRVKGIAPRLALREAMRDPRPEQLTSTALEEILGRLEHLELDATQAEFVLRAALAHGRHAQIEALLAAAQAAGVDVWGVIGEQLRGEQAEAFRAIDLLAALVQERAEATELLAATVVRDDELGARVLEVLERKLDSREAVEVVARALHSAGLADRAQSALASLAGSANPDVASDAANALLARVKAQQRTPQAAVSALEAYGAVEVLTRAVDDPDLAPFADDALARLAASPNPGVAARAAQVVADRLEAALDDPPRAKGAVARIGRLDTLRAVELVARALEQPETRIEARSAMLRLAESDNDVVAARARDELQQHAPAPQPEPPPAPPPLSERPVALIPAIEDPHLRRVVQNLLEGRVVPFLGVGTVFVGRPSEAVWQPGGAYPPTTRELAAYLAERFSYPYAQQVPGLREVCEFIELTSGARRLFETLHGFLAQEYVPSSLHQLVAALPSVLASRGVSLPLIVTTAFDDMLERAFRANGHPCETLTYVARGPHAGTFLHETTDGRETYLSGGRSEVGLDESVTIVLRLCGRSYGLEDGAGTYVVTSDDFADYLVGAGATLPVGVASRLRESHLLFLGVGLTDWGNRTILRRISADELYYRSWAVLLEPDEIERRFWDTRDVDVVDRPLDDYVESLRAALEGVAR